MTTNEPDTPRRRVTTPQARLLNAARLHGYRPVRAERDPDTGSLLVELAIRRRIRVTDDGSVALLDPPAPDALRRHEDHEPDDHHAPAPHDHEHHDHEPDHATEQTPSPKLDAEQRRAIVADLRAQGRSLRAIAHEVGAGKDTIRRDLAALASTEHDTPPAGHAPTEPTDA